MLSIFPSLLIYNLIGISVVRFVIGLCAVYLAFQILSKKTEIAAFLKSRKMPWAGVFTGFFILSFLVAGFLMAFGLYTQIACLIVAYLFFEVLILEIWSKSILGGQKFFYTALIFISISFLFLGPGLYAFDLPF